MSKTQKGGRTEGSLILKMWKNRRLFKFSKITHKHWWKLRTHHIIFQLVKATKYLVSKNRSKPPSPHSCVKYINTMNRPHSKRWRYQGWVATSPWPTVRLKVRKEPQRSGTHVKVKYTHVTLGMDSSWKCV